MCLPTWRLNTHVKATSYSLSSLLWLLQEIGKDKIFLKAKPQKQFKNQMDNESDLFDNIHLCYLLIDKDFE